jgi:NTP pyrophosphatase (non-canonical NTP hydrolase)
MWLSRVRSSVSSVVSVVNESSPSSSAPVQPARTLADLQHLIREMYGEKDAARGVEGTFMWLMQEVGELATALRDGSPHEELAKEFADVLAWLVTIANVAGVDLDAAIQLKYGGGCPGCGQFRCQCTIDEKP